MVVTVEDVLLSYAHLPEFVGLPSVGVETVGNFGSTPLHVAATRGNFEEAHLLVVAGAPLNASGEHGFTPLHEAAAQGHRRVCEFLLASGASAIARNSEGHSPSQVAELAQHQELAQLLADAT
jgi:ankyrin repeat protein